MPLIDHFAPPLSRERHWDGFHSAWANEIVRQLNHHLLPDRFVAEPYIKLGANVEIDVATFQQRENRAIESGGLALATYAPPRPTLVFEADWSDADVFEIQVQKDDGGLQLVAAIELVSPANKDRPSHREAFVRKCASALQQGIALVVIDIVTQRAANFHADLIKALGSPPNASDDSDWLFAAAYRTLPRGTSTRIESWPQTLKLSEILPTLPLWLDIDFAVPLDLEETYEATCDTLRIRR